MTEAQKSTDMIVRDIGKWWWGDTYRLHEKQGKTDEERRQLFYKFIRAVGKELSKYKLNSTKRKEV